jgi:hypothetical protein
MAADRLDSHESSSKPPETRPGVVRLLPEPRTAGVPETGAVESVQEAEIAFPREALETRWRPEYLEPLARAYWRFLNRISLGILRVVYAPASRSVVVLFPMLSLLRFRAPEYVTDQGFGEVTWRIRRGLLVARAGRDQGYLRIRVTRCGPDPAASERELVRVRVEVRNFYPWIRGSGRFARFGAWLYRQTQLRIHVLVTRGFLRSLAALDLPPSTVGALPGEIASAGHGRSATRD